MSKYHVSTALWVTICLGVWVLVNQAWGWVALVTFLYFIAVVWGSIDIRLNFYLKSLNRRSVSNKEIAITFDDGPHPNTLAVLDILDKYRAKATFFCIGSQIEKHPEIIREICKRGHQIGNHTYSHANSFPLYPVSKMEEEIRKTNALILKETGVCTYLFRPPFGVTNPRIAKAIKHMGMESIGWNRRSYDTVSTKEEALKRTVVKAMPGDVVLFHDRLPEAAALLDSYLEILQRQHFTYTVLA